MKKLIALNTIILISLFSLKFSQEDLPQDLRVLSDNLSKTFRPKEKESPIELPIGSSQELAERAKPLFTQKELPETPNITPIAFQDPQDIVTEKVPPNIQPSEFAITPELRMPKIPETKNPLPLASAHAFNLETIFDKKQTPPPPQKEKYNPYPIPKRIAISHMEGYGEKIKEYRTNYSLIEMILAPDAKPGLFLPMIDLRGYRFDNTSYALSCGLMGRYIPKPNTFCQLLGVNLFYDYSNGSPGRVNQIGAGLEVLGKRLDFRANFYAPLGENKYLGRCCDARCINGWFAYTFNAEVGYLAVRSQSFFLYTGIGPYYVTACECEEKKRGVMFRVVPQYKDYLALNLKFSYDPIFRAIFQAELIFSLPLYQISVPEKGPCGILNRQIYQRVERLR